ncbi:MAG: J domain-containing protein [Hyphomicrobium sp.]
MSRMQLADIDREFATIAGAFLHSHSTPADFERLMTFAEAAFSSANGPRSALQAASLTPPDGDTYVSAREVSSRYAEDYEESGSLTLRVPDAFAFRPQEIRIDAGQPLEVLRALRRKLAVVHHPDKSPVETRDAATRRMSRINEMIDAAIAEAEAAEARASKR